MSYSIEIPQKHFELLPKFGSNDRNLFQIGDKHEPNNSYIEGYINYNYDQFEAAWKKAENAWRNR